MLQAALSLYFVLVFFRDAKHAKKNPWIWALVGGLCFFISSFSISQAIFFSATKLAMNFGSAITILVIGIAVGLLAGFRITRSIQNIYLKKRANENINQIDQTAQDSRQWPEFENESPVICKSCHWNGTGEELHQKDDNPGKYVYCPKCGDQATSEL